MSDHDMSDLEKNIGSQAEADDSSSDTSTLLNKPEAETKVAGAATDSVALPAEEATPAEVRRYITEVLTITHQLDPLDAQEIASKWVIGTGRELRKFTPSLYRDIFGPAAAWILYKDVKTSAAQESIKKSPPMSWPARFGIATTIIAFEVLLSVVLTHFLGMAMLAIMIWLYIIGFACCVGVLADGKEKLGGDDKKAMERVENELIKYWGINGNGTKSTP